MTNQQQDEYDSPWKEVLERYFQQFMGFFFPQAHALINCSQPYQSLDNGFQQVRLLAKSLLYNCDRSLFEPKKCHLN